MRALIRLGFNSASIAIEIWNLHRFYVAIINFFQPFYSSAYGYLKNKVTFAVLSFIKNYVLCFIYNNFFPLHYAHFLVDSMPPKKDERKRKGRKRNQRENVTDQPPSEVITTMPTEHVGTSGRNRDYTHPHQEVTRSSGHSDAPAPTVVSLHSMSQPSSSTVYTLSDPLSGLSWSYQTPPTSVSSGQFNMCSNFQEFAVEITFFFLCKSNSHRFIPSISSSRRASCKS